MMNLTSNEKKYVTVFAPATVANVAVGFDILGFPIYSVGDNITVSKIEEPTVVIHSISGLSVSLPTDPMKNTAGIVLQKLIDDYSLPFGFEIKIEKGIPLGSGMGGSAASSVGALVAASHLLDSHISNEKLLKYALLGEELASGAAHADNVSPCLFGGLTLTRSINPVDIVRIPIPENVRVVLVHPHLRLDTELSRSVLRSNLPIRDFVRQSANLAGFISGCYTQDMDLIKRSLSDVLIEPRRSVLIPGFVSAKNSALENGALGCSISGSGPSMFALCDGDEISEMVRHAMIEAFKHEYIEVDSWISKINTEGAKNITQVETEKIK